MQDAPDSAGAGPDQAGPAVTMAGDHRDEPTRAFTEAAHAFDRAVAQVPDDSWHHPALGEWDVRALVGHTSRALSTVITYLAAPAREIEVPDAAAYFVAAAEGVDPADVARRGREAGQALGEHPVAAVHDLVRRSTTAVRAAPPGATVTTAVGGMRLSDYLPTRVFELTVHGLDLLAVTGGARDLPARALRMTLHLAADLALHRGTAGEVALAMTGRGRLPDGFTVL